VNTIDGKEMDAKFKADVAGRPGGENLGLCYACGTCTASCPVSEVDPEFNPRKIIRQVLLGLRREVLSSPVIWRCVQCYSCTAKCPQNVRFRDIVRVLREMAVAEGAVPAGTIEEANELGRLSQRLRRRMAEALVADRGRYDEMRRRVEELAAG